MRLISLRGIAGWVFVLLVFATRVFAQSPAPIPNPNLQLLTNGTVYAIATLPDGSAVFGGYFNVVNGASRSNIAKLRADGTLDPDWNPSANAIVWVLTVDSSGSVYAGGNFTTIGGEERNFIAKLSSTGAGAADTSWNPSPNANVFALAMDGSGNVYAGGYFSTIGGQSRNEIAKLSTSGIGAADANWNPSANGLVSAIAVDGGGNVYAGGGFSAIGGQNRNYIARLSGSGGGGADINWNPSANSDVKAIAVDGGGDVYAGGDFSMIGGVSRNYIAKLSSSGSGAADANWNPSSDYTVWALAVDGGGNLYAGGSFTTIGGQNRNYIAKLSGSGAGTADANWKPSANYSVYALAVDGSANVYVGGWFTTISSQQRFGFAVMSSAGTTTAGADVEGEGAVVDVLVKQPNGGLIVGGSFSRADGLPRANILRLHADGALDPDWNPSASGVDIPHGEGITALAVDGTSNVYAGGYFSTIGGQNRNHIAKLLGSGTGAADASWNPSADGLVNAIAVDGSGNVYAGGYFLTIGGLSRSHIAKLSGSGTGTADPNWNPSVNYFGVSALAMDGSGNIYVGGAFSTIGGVSRNNIAKLSGTGIADANWNPSANGAVLSLAVYGGSVFVDGDFSTIGGQSRSFIAKLSGSGIGAADANWNPSPDYYVYSLAVDGSGNVYAGGNFSTIGGQSRYEIAKLSGSGSGAADANWNPSANGLVNAIAVDGTGNVYAAGEFTRIGNQSRLGLAAFGGDGIFYNGFE